MPFHYEDQEAPSDIFESGVPLIKTAVPTAHDKRDEGKIVVAVKKGLSALIDLMRDDKIWDEFPLKAPYDLPPLEGLPPPPPVDTDGRPNGGSQEVPSSGELIKRGFSLSSQVRDDLIPATQPSIEIEVPADFEHR